MPSPFIEEPRVGPFLRQLSDNFTRAEGFSEEERGFARELIDRVTMTLPDAAQELNPEQRMAVARKIIEATRRSVESQDKEGGYRRYTPLVLGLINKCRGDVGRVVAPDESGPRATPSSEVLAELGLLVVPVVQPARVAAAYRAQAGATAPSMPAFKGGTADPNRPLVVHESGAFFGGEMPEHPTKTAPSSRPARVPTGTHIIPVDEDGTREPEQSSSAPRGQGALTRLGGFLGRWLGAGRKTPATPVEAAPEPVGYSAAEFAELLKTDSRLKPNAVRFFRTDVAIHSIQGTNNRTEYGALVRVMADADPIGFVSASREHHVVFRAALGERMFFELLRRMAGATDKSADICAKKFPQDFGIPAAEFSHIYMEAVARLAGHKE